MFVCLFYLFVSLVQDSLFKIILTVSCHVTNKLFVQLSTCNFPNSLGRIARDITWISHQLWLLNSNFAWKKRFCVKIRSFKAFEFRLESFLELTMAWSWDRKALFFGKKRLTIDSSRFIFRKKKIFFIRFPEIALVTKFQ